RERVRRLPRLRDDREQRALAEDRVAIAELAPVVDLARDAGEPLDQELADEARVPCRSARDQHAALEVLGDARDDLGVELDVAGLLEEAPPHRVDDRLRLLVDLLQEEVLVAALLRRDGVPGDDARLALDRRPVEGRDRNLLARELGHLAVLEEEDAAR